MLLRALVVRKIIGVLSKRSDQYDVSYHFLSCLIALKVTFRTRSMLGLLPPTGAMASDSNWQAEFSCGDRFRGLRQGVPIGELFFADCSCYRP